MKLKTNEIVTICSLIMQSSTKCTILQR